ncbi:MAG: hypothetical protein RR905_02805 [Aurantimicrobium sp.]
MEDEIQALHERIERLQFTVCKLAGYTGHDISELIDEGWLQDGDVF